MGYECHFSRINGWPSGAFDAAFMRPRRDGTDRKVRLPNFGEAGDKPNGLQRPSTDPRSYHLLTAARTTLIPALKQYASEQLAESERPAAYVILPELPRRDGQLDAASLPAVRIGRGVGTRQRSRPAWWAAGDTIGP